MEHTNEAQVHAWLDGELSPDEGAQLEEHIATCADCSALVAEARGLVAASSRILSKLDDVPAGVIPAVSESGRTGGARSVLADRTVGDADHTVRRSARAWWRRPQYAAAAAIAFIALTTSLVARREGTTGADGFATRSVAADVSAPNAAPVDSAAPKVEAAPLPEAETRSALQEGPLSAARRGAASGERARSDPATAATSTAPSASRTLAASSAPSASRTPTAPAPSRTMATAIPPSDVVADASTAPRAPKEEGAKRLSPLLNTEQLVRDEARRLDGERKSALSQLTTTGASAAAAPPSPGALVPTRLLGCYALQPTVAARATGLVARIALEDSVVGLDDTRPLYTARALDSETGERTLWRWTTSARGDVVLLRGEGGATMRFAVGVLGLAHERDVTTATRIDCPSR
ncbi:MAG: zf-HC2 domain-containing protein [Gemmatimonadaceae bacterium]|nr:zf-HC2 domain-containing protein [Gemmatimonadaceae bacterium]